MKCAGAKSLFSLYLDGALTGTQMRALNQHLETCAGCTQEYLSLQRTQQLLTRLARRKAPSDLALKLRVAISQEVAQSKRPYLSHIQIRLENALNAFMVPATAGLVTAIAIFIVLMGFLAPLQADNPDFSVCFALVESNLSNGTIMQLRKGFALAAKTFAYGITKRWGAAPLLGTKLQPRRCF